MALAWYALHSKPNKENLLWEQLENYQVETFFPRMRVRTVNPRARKIKPYFPGYLFARVDFDRPQIAPLRWLPGLASMVCFDDRPASIPDPIILAIRRHIEELNATKKEMISGLKPGERVTILGGPFTGYEAIFDEHISGTERVHVLLKLLHDGRIQLDLPVELVQRKQRSFALAR